ncbi:selenocysteine lyase/cysteine desulfurase [Microbacterium sp. AG790]|uniref:aminotransferase class V-fold PLP-dependent enzyme n=1 Tax=Microbacterium sp. AG790 TaxID=2183995 RepID=UPI000EB3DA22|nr:aminotransferase class V-fold PLP-dependent enzyme [Microbacterium sp. AG790]RKS93690.1 selenocysteine lyase/cysteine desulfurase [Microbacterium sp. AG790]
MGDVNDLQPYLDTFDSAAGYLDWAAFGPLSPAVRAETLADAELLGSGRRSGIDLVSERSDEARGLVAQVLGCAVDEVVLQPSTTHGLQHAMQGLRGTVIVSAQEFPALRVTARRAQDARGVLSVREIEPVAGIVTADAVAEALDDDVTAVAVSLVDFRTGAVADVREIRERIGDRLLIVDAVQGFGVVDADWDAADVVCGNGYKWLRAGRGTGFARFSDRARERIEPVLSGISGMQGDATSVGVPAPLPTAAAYQVAPADHLAAGRLAAALREVVDAGIPAIAAELRARARAVMELADRYGVPVLTPRDRHAGIVTLQPAPHEAAPLAAALANQGVTVTARGTTIRVAPHVGTGADSFVLLGDALAEVAASRVIIDPAPASLALSEPGSADDAPISLEVVAPPAEAVEAASADDITR